MLACPSCDVQLPLAAKFCPECGTKLHAVGVTQAREVRKTVTVLFSDLAGSTALGERLDPEPLRALMARYFDVMRAIIEGHGGMVEKFIGDAIMAVFGIPVLHEDDALRAVRAADEMREGLRAFNAGLADAGGIDIRTRTGVNTGEVVASADASGATMATGDAVNTAARLEQLAGPGEILLGATTWQLVRDAVSVEAIEPLRAKGKAAPVEAYRLLKVERGAPGHARRMNAPVVGRRRELRLLDQVWDRVTDERAPQLFTLLGAAGVGKSRLVREFVERTPDARVIAGHCLPYGEAITYWPLAEALKVAAEVSEADSPEAASAKITQLVASEREPEILSAPLLEAIGLASTGAATEEVYWATRKTLEALARRQPLIVIWDDIQWAEPTFLGLVENLADLARDAPLLILTIARPELLEARPAWSGGKLNATTLLLEPLPADATAQLVDELPGGAVLPLSLRQRIVDAAEGNPLFVEELLAMLVEDGQLSEVDGVWRANSEAEAVTVPPTIHALLAAAGGTARP